MSSELRPDRTAKVSLPEREAEALHEIAATRGGRSALSLLILGFWLAAQFGATVEMTPSLRARTASWPRERIRLANGDALAAGWKARGWSGVNFQLRFAIGSINRYTDRDSVATRLLRPPIQRVLVRRLGYGNGQVLVGERGWLAYQHDYFHVVGPPFLAPKTLDRRRRPGWRLYSAQQPDPVAGLLRFKRQLGRHGVQLVFVPVPNKVSVYPERLRAVKWRDAPRNSSFALLVEQLERHGVPAYDATPDLFRAARARRDPFLEWDTHWSPAGMDAVATALARFLERRVRLPPHEPAGLIRRSARIPKRYELERLLGFPRPPLGAGQDEAIEVVEVLWPDGRKYLAEETPADVVVLGDSFSMVYNRSSNRGVSAGFPEHLAAALDRPVHSIARYDRNQLAQRTEWLRERREVLARARVIVYEVAIRSLSIGDWAPGRLDVGRRAAPARPATERNRKENR